MEQKIFLLFLVLIVCSCVNNNKQKTSTKKLELFEFPRKFTKNNIEEYKLSDLYSKVTGFTLDSAGGPIGHVSKVMIFEKILFIHDSHYAKKIFAFNLEKEGEFMFSIGTKGKGPEEFLRVSDFSIDSLDRQLIVIDAIQRKISYFDLTGEFKTSKRLKFNPLRIFCGKTYLYFIKQAIKDEDFCVEVTDKKIIHVKEYLQKKNYPSLELYDTGFLKFDNKLLLNYPNCDTIFQIKDKFIEPYLAISTGQSSLSLYLRNNGYNNKDFWNYAQEKNNLFENIIFPGIYFEDDKLKSFQVRFNRMSFSFLKSKLHNNEPTRIGYIENDIFKSPVSIVGYDKNYGTIGIINSRSLIGANFQIAMKSKQIISDQLMQLIKFPNPSSNPCIIFLK